MVLQKPVKGRKNLRQLFLMAAKVTRRMAFCANGDYDEFKSVVGMRFFSIKLTVLLNMTAMKQLLVIPVIIEPMK